MGDFAKLRRQMVERHLKPRGISNPLVLKAFGRVPREEFVHHNHIRYSYEDRPLPIGEGQTISQPYIVALMTEALGLKTGERVLEIGTGSGYAAAILGEMGLEVYTIERFQRLADEAGEKLAKWKNVTVVCADGTKGLPEKAPFDGIIVTAGGPKVPEALKSQLKIGGVMVIPVGPNLHHMSLLKVTRTGENRFEEADLGPVAFVPLVGEEGF